MEPINVASIIAALAALASIIAAFVSGVINLRVQSNNAKESNNQRLLSIEEPLLQAAFDLQSRIVNIYTKRFFSFHDATRERYILYTEESTLYRIAQYFCYVEILRRESLYVNSAKSNKIRHTLKLLLEIERKWSTDCIAEENLRIFADEQRYLGECLFEERQNVLSCMNYKDFIKHCGPQKDIIMDEIRADIRSVAEDKTARIAIKRMVEIQNLLIDLLRARDSRHVRFPPLTLRKI